MNFTILLRRAQAGDTEAVEALYREVEGLLRSYAWHDGKWDEDLFQEYCILLIQCIRIFPI